jgi:uncharacterized protein YjlB
MIFVTSFKEHAKYKKELLKLIEKMPYSDGDKKHTDSLYKEDYYLPTEYPRPYLALFYKLIEPYMDKISKKFESKKTIIHNSWFQQYKKGNYHHWHNHVNCHFGNVYYLELPSSELGTKFLNSINDVEVQEGDILTFPSYLYHQSPVNKTNKRKTVISFNTSFTDYINV